MGDSRTVRWGAERIRSAGTEPASHDAGGAAVPATDRHGCYHNRSEQGERRIDQPATIRRPRQILVVGATGRVGGHAAKLLVGRGAQVRALVRDATAARALLPRAVDLVSGDLARPETLPGALTGIDAILLVVPVSPQQAQLEANLVRAAVSCVPAALMVKISGLATYADSFVDSGRRHAQTEALIRASGLPFVFLHPLFFMQNLAFQLEPVRHSGVVRAAVGDARIAMIDVLDVAEAAARLLLADIDRTGATLRLTGSQALQYADIAGAFEARLGRRVVYEPQSNDALRAQLTRAGQPAWHIDLLCQFSRAFAQGMAADVSADAAEVLGRPPRELDVFLDDALAHGGRRLGENPFPT